MAHAQEQAAFGSLQLKLGLQSMPANIRDNPLRRSRILQRSLNEDANEKLPD